MMPVSSDTQTAEEQLVVFQLGSEAYGVRIDVVREIITLHQVTAVPHAPAFVEGVINLRGRVIPVIDLRRRLDLPPTERGRMTRIVVVEAEGGTVGMVVDAVSEVLTVGASAIEGPSPYLGVEVDGVRGVAKLEDRLIILLDLDKILTGDERAQLSRLG
jgi:purine-binding chemotaxis protein CheW